MMDVPANVRNVGAMLGYGDQEIENLIGQKYQEIIDYFSLEEQP